MAAVSTKVLLCDPSSIVFAPDSDQPRISDPATLQALQSAAHQLRELQPVAFPTETVYGLGALALDATAAARIYTTKGRPSDNPLIAHVSSFAMLHTIIPSTFTLPRTYEVLMKHFWPGPLTLLFPTNPDVVPSIITANHPTVAIRMPSHPVARALIALTNAPLAAPSANSSGKPSPTRAEHVFRDLDGKLGIILDGGACDVGLESTVVDGLHPDGNIRVLRPGGVTVEDISRVLQRDFDATSSTVPKVLVHRRDYSDEEMEQAPTTPGMKYRHYSPAVPVTLLLTVSSPPLGTEAQDIASYLASIAPSDTSAPIKVGILSPTDSELGQYNIDVKGITCERFFMGSIADPSVAAQRLFDGLLTLEKAGADLIIIEEIDEVNEGLAVMNRVRKAAGEFIYIRR